MISDPFLKLYRFPCYVASAGGINLEAVILIFILANNIQWCTRSLSNNIARILDHLPNIFLDYFIQFCMFSGGLLVGISGTIIIICYTIILNWLNHLSIILWSNYFFNKCLQKHFDSLLSNFIKQKLKENLMQTRSSEKLFWMVYHPRMHFSF